MNKVHCNKRLTTWNFCVVLVILNNAMDIKLQWNRSSDTTLTDIGRWYHIVWRHQWTTVTTNCMCRTRPYCFLHSWNVMKILFVFFRGGGGIFPKRSTSHYPAKKLFKLQSSLTSQPKSTLPSQYECWRCPQKALMGFIFLHNFSSEIEVVNCLTLPCLVLSSDCLPAPSNDETPFTFGGNSLSNMGPIRWHICIRWVELMWGKDSFWKRKENNIFG